MDLTTSKKNMKHSLLSLLIPFVMFPSAQGQNTRPLEDRAGAVCAEFRQTPGEYEKLFAPGFLAQIPGAQLTAIFTDYFSKLGRCTQVKLASAEGETSGRFDLTFEQGFSVPAIVSIDPTEPHLISGLRFGTPNRLTATLAGIVAELKGLPGETGFLIVKLNKDGMTPLIAHNAEREFAIGSTFKLYILSELAHEVNAHERKWSDVVTLNEKAVSLPSGTLQSWPVDSPLTLHTAASLMISISDNTAADLLLMTLGRERVESVLAPTGHAKPELNMPFLSTLEMFKLKGEPTSKAAVAYLTADPKGRRAYLADKIAAVKREETRPYADGKPAYIDRIEWFASPSDLCRVMNWLRGQTEVDKTVRQILAINPGSGLTIPREKWQYIGFKGGSEPGVLNMTYLLQSITGDWYALSVSWNNQQNALQNEKVFALVQRSLQLITP